MSGEMRIKYKQESDVRMGKEEYIRTCNYQIMYKVEEKRINMQRKIEISRGMEIMKCLKGGNIDKCWIDVG